MHAIRSPTSRSYIYDGSNLLLVLDGSGNVKNRYFNGPNENQVLAEETNIVSSGAGDTHWALTDHEGSVRDVIDNSGSVLDHIQYDSFGNNTWVDKAFGRLSAPAC